MIGTVVSVPTASQSRGANPIVEGVGLCDPQVRVYDDRVYLYATHDARPGSRSFVMHDWWVWTTEDLLHWTRASTLKPEDTYFRKPSAQCWATDAIRRNGKYYFYFSRGPKEIGVVVGDSPVGPWRDPTGKPLIADGSTPTLARDPGILQEPDGTTYIVFGCWDFYIARLNDDMTSLAEKPRLLVLDRKMGPYGPGKTDDKPFLHRRGDQYYLSWGCYYAMSSDVYGPYVYKDTIIHEDRVEPAFRKALTFDRHGSFFELHHQWYFICNDQSWPGTTRYYRDSVICYVHYRDNGEIEPVYLNRLGVGQYDAADAAAIPAANYYGLTGGSQRQAQGGGFEVVGLRAGSTLDYPNVMNLPAHATFTLQGSSGPGCTVEVWSAGGRDALIGTCTVPPTGNGSPPAASCGLTNDAGTCNVRLVVRGGGGGELLRLESIRFDAAKSR